MSETTLRLRVDANVLVNEQVVESVLEQLVYLDDRISGCSAESDSFLITFSGSLDRKSEDSLEHRLRALIDATVKSFR